MLVRLLPAEALSTGLRLRVFVDGVAEALAAGFTRIALERATSESGAYSEITDANTRPTLAANVFIYAFDSATTNTTHWLRARLLVGASDPSPYSAVFACSTQGLVSLKELRAGADGVTPAEAADDVLNDRLLSVQAGVEDFCGQWFEPRRMDRQFRGTDSPILRVPVPIIGIEGVYPSGSTTPLDSARFVAWTARDMPDDRNDPKVELVASVMGSRIFGWRGDTFPKGALHRLVGTFGFLEPDGRPPRRILDVVAKATRWAVRSADGALGAATAGGGLEGPVVKREVDRAREWFQPVAGGMSQGSVGGNPLHAYLAGDAESLAVLTWYKRRSRGVRVIGRSTFARRSW